MWGCVFSHTTTMAVVRTKQRWTLTNPEEGREPWLAQHLRPEDVSDSGTASFKAQSQQVVLTLKLCELFMKLSYAIRAQ